MSGLFDALLKTALVESALDEYDDIFGKSEVLTRTVLKHETVCDCFSQDDAQHGRSKVISTPCRHKSGSGENFPTDEGEI